MARGETKDIWQHGAQKNMHIHARKQQKGGYNWITRNFVIYTRQILFGRSNKEDQENGTRNAHAGKGNA
jgi:hypothetical protein